MIDSSVYAFIGSGEMNQNLILDPYTRYQNWCKRENREPVAPLTFLHLLLEHGFYVERQLIDPTKPIGRTQDVILYNMGIEMAMGRVQYLENKVYELMERIEKLEQGGERDVGIIHRLLSDTADESGHCVILDRISGRCQEASGTVVYNHSPRSDRSVLYACEGPSTHLGCVPMEFVRENQYMRIYHDWRCEAVERELRSMDDNGVCCPNVKCYRIEAKKGYTFPKYIAVDDNAEPGDVVKFDFGDEVVGVGNAKAYKWKIADKLDLRTIAESGEIPKVGY